MFSKILSLPPGAGCEAGREARMESLSSSRLGRLMGRGIRDLADPRLDRPLSPEAEPGLCWDPASLVGVVRPVPSMHEDCNRRKLLISGLMFYCNCM